MADAHRITPMDVFNAARARGNTTAPLNTTEEVDAAVIDLLVNQPEWQEQGVAPGDLILPEDPSGNSNGAVPPTAQVGQGPRPAGRPAAPTFPPATAPSNTVGVGNAFAVPTPGSQPAFQGPPTMGIPLQSALPPAMAPLNAPRMMGAFPLPAPGFVFFGAPPPPAVRPPTAKKANVLAPRAPRPYLPPTVYSAPPPGPTKRNTQLKAKKEQEEPAKRKSLSSKARVPLAQAEAIYLASVARDSTNVTCTFVDCGHVSKNPGAHKSHMLSHAEFMFRCPYCGSLRASQQNLAYHMHNSCKNRPGAGA
ncbi:hypothetical protein AURDEDRAFT_122706 [Auricularia subglabra TFB-10046 SS5]|nr:hypothetical protein AURDEDRAFT_122706 [Auricularia subglabra TFB-10046 SS5]